jgi:hypothetical protein
MSCFHSPPPTAQSPAGCSDGSWARNIALQCEQLLVCAQKRFHSGNVWTFEVLTATPPALGLQLHPFTLQSFVELGDLILQAPKLTVRVVLLRQ